MNVPEQGSSSITSKRNVNGWVMTRAREIVEQELRDKGWGSYDIEIHSRNILENKLEQYMILAVIDYLEQI